MSRDQKPGKVRVIAGGAVAPQPERRRTDRDANAPAGTAADREPDSAAPVTGGLAFVPVILFLLCCASGGIATTLLILPSVPQ